MKIRRWRIDCTNQTREETLAAAVSQACEKEVSMKAEFDNNDF